MCCGLAYAHCRQVIHRPAAVQPPGGSTVKAAAASSLSL